MSEILQIVGAVLVLIPFAWLQVGRMNATSAVYLAMNLVGSGLLALLALFGGNWGFLLLEGSWTLVTAWGVIGALRRRPGSVRGGH